MSTISPEAPPTVRQSVYWLSVLATRLQKETSSVDTSRSTRVKTPNSNTRSLNHLAALLTRGKNDSDSMESTRIVAVTLGSFQADSIQLSVFAGPPSSPTTSPTVSPSSSSSSGVADCPDGTTAATKVEKVASLVFTRNSRDEEGERSSFTIPMAPAESLLCAFSLIVRANYSSLDVRDTILLAPLSFTPAPIPFAEYAQQSLTLLRAAAARMTANPGKRNEIMDAVYGYFVASCRSKLLARTNKFWSAYTVEKLGNWIPTKEIPECDVTIESSFFTPYLDYVGLHPTSASSYPFTQSTMTLWWKEILHFLRMFTKVLRDKTVSASVVGIFSLRLHTFVQKLPQYFWALESLNDHILQCQQDKDVQDHQKDNDDQNNDEDNPMEDSLDENPSMDSTKAPPYGLFSPYDGRPFRMDHWAAWTTGPQVLLHGRLSRVSAPIHVSVIDLPRAPIPAVDVDTLFTHWVTKAGWSKQIGEKILPTIQKMKLHLSPGACHCEAGLMASFLLHSSKDGDSEEKWKEQASEPAVLSGAFETQGMTGEHAIGVAKKCCPLCRMLAEVLEEKHGVRVTLPGQHTTFFAWVPLSWLHPETLHEMERRLLKVIYQMAEGPNFTSRMSSPASDGGIPDPDPEPNTVASDVAGALWTTLMSSE